MLRRCFFLALALAIAAPAATAAPGASAPAAGESANAERLTRDLTAARARVDAGLKARSKRAAAWKRAAAARDEAAAVVEQMKRDGVSGAPLEDGLRKALALDEETSVARSSLLASEADVAKGGALVLRLYDALLLEQRRTIESLGKSSALRVEASARYQRLAQSRDAVRVALLPVLDLEEVKTAAPPKVDVAPRADDDIETLLEKADLARDLEERYLRRAEAVRRRILEVEEEREVARGVQGMLGRGALFDEEDRRMLLVRPDVSPARNAAPLPSLRGPAPSTSTDTARAPAPRPEDVSNDASGDDNGISRGEAPSVADVTESAPSGPGLQPIAAPPTSSTVVAPASTPSIAERAFTGTSDGNADAFIAGLMTSGDLSLPQLKALQKKLESEAQRMRSEGKRLKGEAAVRARQ